MGVFDLLAFAAAGAVLLSAAIAGSLVPALRGGGGPGCHAAQRLSALLPWDVDLILASASPRRAELLAAARIPFRVQTVEVDEAPFPGEDPAAYVERLAVEKARALVCRDPGTFVLAADTTVVVDGLILGKPADDEDAARMLEMLSGRDHEVLTGVAIRRGPEVHTHVERSRVRFLQLSPDEIAWYVGTGEPQGKAGAYAIQGLASRFVEHIHGSYSNVVGLPVAEVYQLLCRLGAGAALRRQPRRAGG